MFSRTEDSLQEGCFCAPLTGDWMHVCMYVCTSAGLGGFFFIIIIPLLTGYAPEKDRECTSDGL